MNAIKNFFLKTSLRTKIIILVVVAGVVWFGKPLILGNNQQQPQYQTAQAQKGTLIESVTSSGTVSSTSGVSVSTQVSGIVSQVYVKNGDRIEAGKPIAKLTLDQSGQQKQAESYASYLSAKNNMDAANATAYSLRSSKDTTWEKFYNLAIDATYQNPDGSPRDDIRNSSAEFQSAQGDWLAAEAKYKNQQSVITQTQVALNAAWLSYQQSSSTVTAPISGTISGLTIQNGSVITTSNSSTTSGTSNATTSSQKIATVKSDSTPTITVNLTEIDVPKVSIGDRATLTFDAFADKTFTGKVTTIDTDGSVSSGVTSYPTTISIDVPPANLYPNMSASASIITNTKDDVVTVPAAAVQTANGESTVRVLKNGKVDQRTVQTGLANDTDIEIVSGVSEGETVIVGQLTSTTTSSGRQTSTSPFGGLRTGGGFGGGGGGGGNFRIAR